MNLGTLYSINLKNQNVPYSALKEETAFPVSIYTYNFRYLVGLLGQGTGPLQGTYLHRTTQK